MEATERALRAVDDGDLDLLLLTVRLHPGVTKVPVHGPLILTVLDGLAGDATKVAALPTLAGPLVANRINTGRIVAHWDDLLRLGASIHEGAVCRHEGPP